MQTNTVVELALLDVTAKKDSQPDPADAQSFCDPAQDLKQEKAGHCLKYGTLETRQFAMDGSFSLFPDAPAGQFWGWWSKQQSGADGAFSAPPRLTVNFVQPHSSAGITLHFYPPTMDWASKVDICWYSDTGDMLERKQYTPNAVDYFCAANVSGWTRLELTFLATSRPGRYVKLTALDYGTRLTFSGEDVVSAHLLEEVDLLSSEISINTLDLELYDQAGLFSLLNPEGVASSLQQQQQITVWEEVRPSPAEPVSRPCMGVFYLDSWDNPDGTLASFSAVDAVGLLDKEPFEGGLYDRRALDVCIFIFEGTDVSWSLADCYHDQHIKGWLPQCSRREALQQLAFALGAVVDCSRGKHVRIYPPAVTASKYIGSDRKFMGSPVSQLPQVTGAWVTAHQYRQEDAQEELYKADLQPGIYRVDLSDPASWLNASGAELQESSINHAVLKVAQAGTVTLTGYKYKDVQTVYRRQASDLSASVPSNLRKVEQATLVDPSRGDAVAQRILNQSKNRLEQTFQMVLGTERLADMLVVENQSGSSLRGTIRRMEIDLTGGFLADVTVVGQQMASGTDIRYAGEFFAGEKG